MTTVGGILHAKSRAMKIKKFAIASIASIGLLSNSAIAGICDYRPSFVIGKGASTALAVAGGAAAGTGVAMQAAGFYTLVHAGSGLTMLGSTLAGGSAAGTVGIIAGTGGAIGTISAVLLAPVTIVIGGITAVGIGGLEAACYFTDDRITEYEKILEFMRHLSLHHPEDRFQLVMGPSGREDDAIKIWNPDTEALDLYMISDLYIVNGTLMLRRWGFDRKLGYVAYVPQQDVE